MAVFLSLVWFHSFPAKYGGQKGTANFLEALAEQRKSYCLCAKSNQNSADSSIQMDNSLPNSKWQFLNPFCWLRIIKKIKSSGASHLIVEYPYYAIPAWLAKKFLGTMVILHEHNVESIRFKNIENSGWRLLFVWEKWFSRFADMVLYKTEADRETAKTIYRLDATKLHILPYGINGILPINKKVARDKICSELKIDTNDKILLFAGTIDYLPNAMAVEYLYKKVAPLLARTGLSFTILICGRNKIANFQYLKNLTHASAMQLGEVPNIDKYFAAADAFINPVTEINGVQTKNIDALASGCKLVCFADEQSKLLLKPWGKSVFSCSSGDWNEFTQQIMRACISELPLQSALPDALRWERIVEGFLRKVENRKGK